MDKVRSLAAALVVLAACSSSAQAPRQPAPSDVVGAVGSSSITLAEVDEKALQQPASNFGSAKLSQALYEARAAALDEIIATRLFDQEAKAKGVERSALIEKEITAKIEPVTDATVADWYQLNKNRVQGASLEQASQAIKNYLTQERMQSVRERYITELRSKTTVRVNLDPPRQQVAAADGPARGPENAPI